MKLGDARIGQRGGDPIADRAKRRELERELGRDDHRDANVRLCEGRAGGADPGVIGRLAEQDPDVELAREPRRPHPWTEVVALDDLDDVAVQDPADFRVFGGSNHGHRAVSFYDVKRFLGPSLVLSITATAHAGPLADALARHTD